MSVLTKDEDGRYILYAKGAGSKIFSKLGSMNYQPLLDRTVSVSTVACSCSVGYCVGFCFQETIVEEWSEDAFRCLVFAYKLVRFPLVCVPFLLLLPA